MGRKLTTGRFDTREELVERIKHLYQNTRMSVNAISKVVQISPVTCGKIVDDFDAALPKQAPTHRPTREKDRALTEAEMEAIERMTEGARDVLWSCGHGYAPDACRVHLPTRLMNDVFAQNDLDEDYNTRGVVLGAKWAKLYRQDTGRK